MRIDSKNRFVSPAQSGPCAPFFRPGFLRILCVCLAMLFASAGLFSIKGPARAATDEEKEAEAAHLVDASRGYSPVLYNNTSGLPTSEANAIVQTSEGFIWIGSYGGLIRYDGNTFERIDSVQTGISSVVSLFVDSKERLWAGTNDSGVGVQDRGEWTIFNKQNGLKSLLVRSIVEDGNGLIYLGTAEGVNLVDENLNVSSPDDKQISKEYVRMLKMGSNNTVYALTIDGAIFTMKDGRLVSYYSPQDLDLYGIHAILPDEKIAGNIYCATKGSSKVYYGTLGKELKEIGDVDPVSSVNSIDVLGDEIWVCADNGIARIIGDQHIVLENIPMTTSIEGLMADYQSNLWFVSSQQGVMKIVPNRFADLYDQYQLPDDVVYTTCLSKGKLFIGTKTRGLIIMENRQILSSLPVEKIVSASGVEYEEKDLIRLLSKAKIRSILKDSKGQLWFSSFSDDYPLVRYDGKVATVFAEQEGLPSERVRTVCECSDGTIVAACTGGVAMISGNQITHIYGEADGIENDEILTICETQHGELLIGTDGDGIYVFKNGVVKHISTDNGLKSDVVMRIKKDRIRDIYWIVTSNSIAYITSDFDVVTIKNFPYANNFDLYQNENDDMWVLSSNGIYEVPTKEMISNDKISPFFYGRDNGLACFATSNSYSELTDEGDLYIAGSSGVVLTNINEADEVTTEVNIIVPFIDADGEKIYPDENGDFTIKATTRKLTVYPYCFNYSLVNPEMTYTLEGFDRIGTTVRRSELGPVSYTNLSGGEYTFRLQMLTAQGDVQKEITVTIVKTKAFTETTRFKALMILLLIAVILLLAMLFARKRTEKLVKKEREQRLLVREIVEAFAKVIDMKDRYTNGHSTRVAEYTAMLARELGYDEETVDKYRNIALLHDIGKVGISSETLNKPGRLTDEEFKEIKSHSGKGYNVLKNISIMPELAIGARDHHERPDGHGYPKGLKGEEIPRVAQIIAVADTFDAMYSDRPYRKRMNFEKAISIIREVSGTQLTEDVVDAFLRLVDRGEFRAPDDIGGGSTEDISNIHKKEGMIVSGENGKRFAKPSEDTPDDPSEKTDGKTEEKTTPSENSVESEKGKEKK